MKLNKYISLSLSIVLISGNLAMHTYAEPIFARSAKEWERLRDNTLEYDEIQGLIEEYNATVKNNEVAYKRFVSDYGRTNTEVRNAYRDAADTILANIDIPEPESPMYASALASSVSAEATAKNLLNNADNSSDDAMTQRLTYDMAKDTLIQTAKTNMINYFSKLHDIEKAEINVEKAKRGIISATGNANIGTGTYDDILTARETLTKAENSLKTERSEADELRKKLIVMTGWAYNANPEISVLPEPDFDKINAINLSYDIETAKNNNYTLKINKRKFENVTSDSNKQNLITTVSNNENNIAISMNTAYKNLAAAKEAYEYAKEYANLKNTNLSTATISAGVGSISNNDLQEANDEKRLADIAYVQAKYALLLSYENYNMALNGLAGAGNQ